MSQKGEVGMKPRKQFTFYYSYLDALRELPDGQREQAYDALMDMAFYGIQRELPETAQRVAMKLVIPNLVASRRKALAAQGKSDSVKSTGRSKKEKEIEKENEIENEIKTETETEKEAESEGEGEGKGPAQEPGLEGASVSGCLQRDFEAFWEEYPVKLGKDAAWSLWLEIKPELKTMMQSVAAWRQSTRWTKEGGRYIPNAAKFLEEGYVNQSPPKPQRAVPTGASGELSDGELEAMRRMMEHA